MTTPPTNQSLTWVYTEDLEGTCRFYTEVVGFAQVLDQGLCRIFRTSEIGRASCRERV